VATKVNALNFVRAETNRMFADIARNAGGTGIWTHNRVPTPLDEQTVIRMNRDTLYSFVVADLSQGADLTLPEADGRYLSAMVINQDHYINQVFHDAGTYRLTAAAFGSPYVGIGVRILVDPNNPDDVASVNALQDQLALTSVANTPFAMPDYDTASFDATRNALLDLARGLDDFSGAFGTRDEVNPIQHLIASAAGWGGLPVTEAFYAGGEVAGPLGEYQVTVGDVPVDAFWSITVYDEKGFMDPAAKHGTSVNSVTATRNDAGTLTVNFGIGAEDKPNYLSIMPGWNYLVRLYRPRPEILDGSWTFPAIEPVTSS
jgi:hypothetical protein